MATYLITGGSRGIGLTMARMLSARGEVVVATARNVEGLSPQAREVAGVRWVPLDVLDAGSIESLPERLATVGVGAIDVLINNAGVSSTARKLDEVTAAELQRVFMVNAFAPVLVAKSLRGMLEAGRRRLIVNVSSQLGSITNNDGGSSYPYRGSKTALNQMTVCMANELRTAGCTCVVVHPGWVRTDMGGPEAPLSAVESAGHLVSLIDRLGPKDSGRFFNYDGGAMPW
jgi:NAD(P)-dependent dehydrogenase (short-subunit alcohol dehydrogenase family)